MILQKTLWRLLRLLPAMRAWRIAHSMPPGFYRTLARVSRAPPPQGLDREVLGVHLPSPVGVGAGLDKDGRLAPLVESWGAGFHVVGSVLPRPHEGVEPKILVRLPNGGTINRLGLPSPGVERVLENLAGAGLGIPLAFNIAGFTPRDYGLVYERLPGYAAWVEVNISCPNVEDHSSFEDPEVAEQICPYLKPKFTPLLLKIPNTRDTRLLERYLRLAVDCGMDGIVAGNTRRINYDGVNAGLGGPDIYPVTLNMVRFLRSKAPEGFVIIGVGGVDSGRAARTLLQTGADLVEVVSAVVTRGPGVISEINRTLARPVRRRILPYNTRP